MENKTRVYAPKEQVDFLQRKCSFRRAEMNVCDSGVIRAVAQKLEKEYWDHMVERPGNYLIGGILVEASEGVKGPEVFIQYEKDNLAALERIVKLLGLESA
jgi:hypothetical protein